MTFVPGSPLPQEVAWARGEAETVAAIGAINAATAALVGTIGMLLDTDGWHGHGIQSVEHWVCWKADVAKHRASGLVRIARRRGELPVCFGLFEQGRLTEDAMVRIARRVPAERDAEVAGWATIMTIAQLTRVLATLPELSDPDASPKPDPERHLRCGTRADGWGYGTYCLPPDELALFHGALVAGRDAEFRDRQGLDPDAELDGTNRPGVSWADALVRVASEAIDTMDATFQRTGYRGNRHQIVIHHDVDPHGQLGPGQFHLGGAVPDPVARYLGCDADVVINAYRAGQLLGITPTVRTPSRALRRYLERRDGGCVHPLCEQKAWLHMHHLVHWEANGPTDAYNLYCLCPLHHRALHHGDFTIDGNPETGTLVFTDSRGQRIEPPATGPPAPAPRPSPPPEPPRLHPAPRRTNQPALVRLELTRIVDVSAVPSGTVRFGVIEEASCGERW